MPEEVPRFTLADLQRQIDFIRENNDDWASFVIQAEVGAAENILLVTEFTESYVDEDEKVFVLVS